MPDTYEIIEVVPTYGGKPVLMFEVNGKRFQVPVGLVCKAGDRIGIIPKDDHKSILITAKAVRLLHSTDDPAFAAMASTKAAVRLAELILCIPQIQESRNEGH